MTESCVYAVTAYRLKKKRCRFHCISVSERLQRRYDTTLSYLDAENARARCGMPGTRPECPGNESQVGADADADGTWPRLVTSGVRGARGMTGVGWPCGDQHVAVITLVGGGFRGDGISLEPELNHNLNYIHASLLEQSLSCALCLISCWTKITRKWHIL
jgi:hypothetical protein